VINHKENPVKCHSDSKHRELKSIRDDIVGILMGTIFAPLSVDPFFLISKGQNLIKSMHILHTCIQHFETF
jgi:hypothetical protein